MRCAVDAVISDRDVCTARMALVCREGGCPCCELVSFERPAWRRMDTSTRSAKVAVAAIVVVRGGMDVPTPRCATGQEDGGTHGENCFPHENLLENERLDPI
jgi:hypothetical protein